MPQCGYIQYVLSDIKCNVQKHITLGAIYYTSPLVRDKPLGAPAYCETRPLGSMIMIGNVSR